MKNSVFVMWRALVQIGTGPGAERRRLEPEPETSGDQYNRNQEPVVPGTPGPGTSGAWYPGTRNQVFASSFLV